ncbi:MAG: adenosylmethionine decarboxylase [Desulfobacterales bacterium]|nr:adenosylmethionine decarboxylase [Desulfobacterales bacterium]
MENTIHFEGPEKKLEIILFSSLPDLRSDINGRWEKVVKASRSQIISKASTENMDAYLLSESSLFVWDDRILMITCGQTTLIRSLSEIINIVGKANVAFVFYERKNCMFPQEQPSSFEDDVAFMVEYFPGKYYKLGPVNHDHVDVFYSSHANETPEQDATLQLLMHDLDQSAMDFFCKKNVSSALEAGKISGLDSIYPRMVTDSYLFSPYGYSLNGIRNTSYITVHVTPQPEVSFASFETNIIEKDYSRAIKDIISIFKPGKFSLALTTSMDEHCLLLHSQVADAVPGYSVTDKSLYEFDCGYSVTFLNLKLET